MLRVGGGRGIFKRAMAAAAPAPSFSPLSLFAAGEQGYWLDPSDMSTMFQDSAGTTAVTAAGQPVGLIQDKSGNGHHFSQSTDANRPVLQQDVSGNWYLDFNGTNSNLLNAGVVIGTTLSKATVWYGAKSDTAKTASFHQHGNGTNPTGAAFITYLATNTLQVTVKSSTPSNRTYSSVNQDIFTLTRILNPQENDYTLNNLAMVNGVAASLTGGANTGNLNYSDNQIHRIGSTTGSANFLDGRIYQLINRYALSTTDELDDCDAYVNTKTGAY